MIEIRAEEPRDGAAVHGLNRAAFEGGPEADLVDRLRDACEGYLAFVAVEDGSVVGHILFTPVTLDGSGAVGMGLAPMAVAPSHQRRGIGSRLVRHGLDRVLGGGCPFVIVVGHPGYYPRFGFEPASRHRLRCPWEGVPDEAFMALVADGGVLPPGGGVVRYRAEFDDAV